MDTSGNTIHEYDSIQFGIDANYMSLRNTNTEGTDNRTPNQEIPVTPVSR